MADMQAVEERDARTTLDLAEAVDEAIGALTMIRESHPPIEVEVSGGTVTLRGLVSSKIMRRMVVHAAATVPGVQKVIDQLAEDSQIIMDVAAALAADPTLGAHQPDIGVLSYMGEVTLYGGPIDEAQQPRAMEIAGKVAGVRRVIGKLTGK